MAHPARFERAAYCLGGNRSILLSYGCKSIRNYKQINKVCQSAEVLVVIAKYSCVKGCGKEKEYAEHERQCISKSPEKKCIQPAIFLPERYDKCGSILSYKEVKEYFDTYAKRRCAPTQYALSKKVRTGFDHYEADGGEACFWYLRSVGPNNNDVCTIKDSGEIHFKMSSKAEDRIGTRPVLWISFDADYFDESGLLSEHNNNRENKQNEE